MAAQVQSFVPFIAKLGDESFAANCVFESEVTGVGPCSEEDLDPLVAMCKAAEDKRPLARRTAPSC